MRKSELPRIKVLHYFRNRRIEAASGDEPRNKLNKSNGGQI